MIVYHITEPAQWEQAQQHGVYAGSTRDASLDDVGFVHCSFPEQVERVAVFLYADRDEDLLVLEVDTDRTGAAVRVENLDGGSENFPHVYGPIPVEAVQDVRVLRRDGGRWRQIPVG